MGKCLSKHDDVASIPAGRRRLSVSQSAEAKEDGNGDRGTVKNVVRGGSSPSRIISPEEAERFKSLADGKGRRLSVTGIPSAANTQRGFDNKRQNLQGDRDAFDALGIGYVCRKGLKPESPNQDDFFIFRMDDWAMFGIFDGHGPNGHDISFYVQQHLPALITEHPLFVTDPLEALRSAFVTVHAQLVKHTASPNRPFDCSLSGTTATVLVYRFKEKKLYAAWVGDSRCVLATRDPKGKHKCGVAVDLTHDHKPNNDIEKKRILANGGQVRRLEGDVPYRVFLKGKLYPGLAMSRALGDSVGTAAGVIAEPELREYDIDPSNDQSLIVCSDGVWEFITSQEAVEMVGGYHPDDVHAAAENLAAISWKRWVAEEGNVVDDITAQVINLRDGTKPIDWEGDTQAKGNGAVRDGDDDVIMGDVAVPSTT